MKLSEKELEVVKNRINGFIQVICNSGSNVDLIEVFNYLAEKKEIIKNQESYFKDIQRY